MWLFFNIYQFYLSIIIFFLCCLRYKYVNEDTFIRNYLTIYRLSINKLDGNVHLRVPKLIVSNIKGWKDINDLIDTK